MVHPILPPDVWHAVKAKLDDPARRTSTGNAPKWLGSGIYLTREQMLTQTASRHAKIASIEEQLARSTESDPLAPIAGNPDADDVWDKLTLEQRRVCSGVPGNTFIPGPGYALAVWTDQAVTASDG